MPTKCSSSWLYTSTAEIQAYGVEQKEYNKSVGRRLLFMGEDFFLYTSSIYCYRWLPCDKGGWTLPYTKDSKINYIWIKNNIKITLGRKSRRIALWSWNMKRFSKFIPFFLNKELWGTFYMPGTILFVL